MTTKTLQEQWQDDCERLTQPHLQWEVLVKSALNGVYWTQSVCDAQINEHFNIGREQNIRRIDSLELPFDLADANNGGKTQIMNIDGDWFDSMDNTNTIAIKIYNLGKYLDVRMKESRLKTTGVNHG